MSGLLAEISALRHDLSRTQGEVCFLQFKHVLRNYHKQYNPDQPRDDDGRWTSEGGDDAAGNVNPLDTWGRPETLQDHYERHGGDFDATSPEDYAAQANRFLQDAQDDNFPTLIDKDGNIKPYDADTNTFGSYNSDYTTRTFMKSDDDDYFAKETAKVLGDDGSIINGSEIPDPYSRIWPSSPAEEPIAPEDFILPDIFIP